MQGKQQSGKKGKIVLSTGRLWVRLGKNLHRQPRQLVHQKGRRQMKHNIKDVITPHFKAADGVIDIEGKNHQRSLPDAENKFRDFIEAADPGFFQNGGDVVEMKGMEQRVAVDQNNRQRQHEGGQ